ADAEYEPDPLRLRACRRDGVEEAARRLDVHARTGDGPLRDRRLRARRQPRLARGEAAGAGVRGRHDPRGDRDPREARIALPAGKLIVERRDDGVVVGRVGLKYYDPATWERSAAPDAQPELGWAIARAHWGRGYATEAARAVRDWSRHGRLVSLITADNVRSQ